MVVEVVEEDGEVEVAGEEVEVVVEVVEEEGEVYLRAFLVR